MNKLLAIKVIEEFMGSTKASLLAALLLTVDSLVESSRLVKYLYLLQREAIASGLINERETFEFRNFVNGPYSPEAYGALGILKAIGVLEEVIDEVTIQTPLGPVKIDRQFYKVTGTGRVILRQILSACSKTEKLVSIARRIIEEHSRQIPRDTARYNKILDV